MLLLLLLLLAAEASAKIENEKIKEEPKKEEPKKEEKEGDKKETKKEEKEKEEKEEKKEEEPPPSMHHGFAVAVCKLIGSMDGAGGEIVTLRPKIYIYSSRDSTVDAGDVIDWEGDKEILNTEMDDSDEYNWQDHCIALEGMFEYWQ